MTFANAIVWIDHRRADVVKLSARDELTARIDAPDSRGRVHRKSGIPGSGHAATDERFMNQVAAALTDVDRVLVAGPGEAKVHFASHLKQHFPDVERRLVGVETLDHPSHGELVAHARARFTRIDRLDGVDLR